MFDEELVVSRKVDVVHILKTHQNINIPCSINICNPQKLQKKKTLLRLVVNGSCLSWEWHCATKVWHLGNRK